MQLLVTGGAGFIGSNAVRYWLERYPDDRVPLKQRLAVHESGWDRP